MEADLGDMSVDSWMAEIDTAMNGYDTYCDRLINAPVASIDDFGDGSGSNLEPPIDWPFIPPNFGNQIESGGQNWDWGLMLMQ